MLTTETARQQEPVAELKTCVERLTEDEVRIAIAYMLVKTKKNQQQAETTLIINNPSLPLAEMMTWIDMMNDSSRKKLSLYLMKKLAPKPPNVTKMNIGRRKGNSR